MSNKLITHNLGSHIMQELKLSSSFRIIVPFIKNEIVQMLNKHIDLSKIELITRFEESDFIHGVSDISAIETLYNGGARIYGVENLHSKVYIFDTSAIVSSGNMTLGGFNNNHECGILTRDLKLVDDMNLYFNTLKNSKVLDDSLLKEMKKNLNVLSKSYVKPTIVGAVGHGAKVKFEATNYFFVNIGYITKGVIREERRWEDFVKYNFISAGQGRKYSNPLNRLMPGNVVFAYVSNHEKIGGYIGVGIVKEKAVRVNEFKHNGELLSTLKKNLKGSIFKNSDNADLSEYLVKVDWRATLDIEKGSKPHENHFVHRYGFCSLENQLETVNWLLERFNVENL